MSDLNLVSEQERAIATVTQCSLQLRRAQDKVRCAGETLRRAIRTADNAEADLGDATRRLDRMESPMAKVGFRLGLMTGHGVTRRPTLHQETDGHDHHQVQRLQYPGAALSTLRVQALDRGPRDPPQWPDAAFQLERTLPD